MTQTTDSQKISALQTALLLAAVLAVVVGAVGGVWWWLTGRPVAALDALFMGLLCWAALLSVTLLSWSIVQHGIRKLVGIGHELPTVIETDDSEPKPPVVMVDHLRQYYGLLWRRHFRLLLIVGEPDQIEAIAPGLATQHWQMGEGTVLLWGGSVRAEIDAAQIAQWRALTRWRGLDGVVWALSPAQSADAGSLTAGVRRLQQLADELHWQLPLHLWQVCASQWSQAKRTTQAVGCHLPRRLTEKGLESRLHSLLEPLRQQGWQQISEQRTHDFLLRLSQDLRVEGIARWRQALAPWWKGFAGGLPLRGLWFSLPMVQHDKTGLANFWLKDPAWQGVVASNAARPRRLGWSAPRLGHALMLVLALAWGMGLLLSFVGNREQILQVQQALAALEQAPPGDEQRLALYELIPTLDRLQHYAEQGVPWRLRLGLSQNDALLAAMWPPYVEANHRLLRDPAVERLQQRLTAWVRLPAGSPERARRADEAYDLLKAYLMMARPEKTDAAFLTQVLSDLRPERSDLSYRLGQFYAEQLAAHPQWRIDADPTLIAQARQRLLGQWGQRNAEASLYQQVLASAADQHPALGLAQWVGDSPARSLFSATVQVPGVFTRQAWEGQVRPAIEAIAQARREQIDWVLSDQPTELTAELSPEQLRQRLTERYFDDYSGAWLKALNSLRWRPADSLGEVIDQLTLMSDARQSPLLALINTLAYQGQAGSRTPALADSLLQSAQQLIGRDTDIAEPNSPLDNTFGPLLALLAPAAEGQNHDERLNLQAFLTQVTRVRLNLQQVSSAADPQAMIQALAQSVFQGQRQALTDTQAYGQLIAASLGGEWGALGQTLFVRPLEQAWQQVLAPSAASLNRQWQRAIVSDWHSAFASRYPFAATDSDASLPMLGQMIRADSGRIEQFLQRQLGGVLRKEGSQWVADSRQGQGLRLNPEFLAAINQLSQLADVLYTDGGLGLSFELRGKAVRDVVDTHFTLNGQEHHYFNQRESWQRFSWPGYSERPGTHLTWTSVHTGVRLFGDYPGTWGLIRLLEHAQLTALDDGDSRYRMVLKAPDGLDLTWHLRTELGAGPMTLLALRGFKLPTQIFLADQEA